MRLIISKIVYLNASRFSSLFLHYYSYQKHSLVSVETQHFFPDMKSGVDPIGNCHLIQFIVA